MTAVASKTEGPPPSALWVMCNECGQGTAVPLPVDQGTLVRCLAVQAWYVVGLSPPSQVPHLLGILCGECAPKVFSPEVLQAAEARRQQLLQG